VDLTLSRCNLIRAGDFAEEPYTRRCWRRRPNDTHGGIAKGKGLYAETGTTRN
jgi:hypothetical protein